jgi:hypothetical protein
MVVREAQVCVVIAFSTKQNYSNTLGGILFWEKLCQFSPMKVKTAQ